MLCFVVKHLEAMEHERSVGVKHGTQSGVFPYLLSALLLPKCFTKEQSAVEASLFLV